MSAINVESLLQQALNSMHGLALSTVSPEAANELRRKLYLFRNQRRRSGDYQYDTLSFLAKANGNLHIVKRQVRSVEVWVEDIRPLELAEASAKVIARGPSRLGLINEKLLQAFSIQKP